MAHEFIARKGLISSGSVNVYGSVTASYFVGDGSQLTNISTVSVLSSSLSIDTYLFVGNGITTNYQVSKSYADSALTVTVGGLTYVSPDDYTVIGSTISFTEAPTSASNILIKGLMNVAENVTGSFSGSFAGNGEGLTNVSASFVEYSAIANKPTLISGSTASSPSQGTVRVTINGVNTDVDTGLQTGDSPTFAALTVNGAVTAREFYTQVVSSSIIYQSGSTKFGDSDDDVMSVTGSLVVSGSGTFKNIGPAQFSGSINISGSSMTITSSLLDVGGPNPAIIRIARNQAATYLTNNLNTGIQFQQSSSYWIIGAGNDDAFSVTRGSLNIGGDSLFKINSTGNITLVGNVGIGTTSPTNKLTINGGLDFSAGAFSGTAPGIWSPGGTDLGFVVGAATQVRIDTSGNVGIGTASPLAKLDVVGGPVHITPTGSIFYALKLVGLSGASKQSVIQYNGTNAGSSAVSWYAGVNAVSTTGNFDIYESSNTYGISISSTTGNVGIGTTSPTEKLEVANGSIFVNGETSGFIIDAIGNKRVGLMKYAGVEGALTHASNTVLRFGRTNQTSVTTGSFTEEMRIDTSGNVGIGTTSPSWKLTAYGTSNADVTAQDATGAMIMTVASGVGYLSTNTANPLILRTNSTERVRIDSSGNVGIGTTSPSYKLDVNSGGIRIDGKSLITANGYFIGGSAGFRWNSSDDLYNNVVMYDNGNMYVRGNVGIGTTSPVSTLHSVGTVTIGNAGLTDGRINAADSMLFYIDSNNDDGNDLNYFSWAKDSATGAGTELMRLTAGGNIGVGTSFPKTYTGFRTLTIGASTLNGGVLTFASTYNSGDGAEIYQNTSGTLFFNINSVLTAAVINSSGSVGIGTTNPTHKLHISSATDNAYALRIQGETNNEANVWTGIGIAGELANTKAAIIFQDIGQSYSRGKLHFALNNETNQNNATPADARMTITNDGNVGIGTTSPKTRLDVNSGWLNTVSQSPTGTANSASVYFTNQDPNYGILMGVLGSGTGWMQVQRTDGTATTYPLLLNPNGGNVIVAGSLGVGTTSPGGVAEFNNTNNGNAVRITSNPGTAPAGIVYTTAGVQNWSVGVTGSDFVFQASNIFMGSERVRLTNNGYFKASSTGNYLNSSGTYHELRTNAATWIAYNTNTNASPAGFVINYGVSPNGTGNEFLYCEDNTALRFSVRSNGGIANYSANNAGLSDARIKKEISPSTSMWNKIAALEIVTYKYIDQTHDDVNLGVIAQQVEQVEPVWVDTDGYGNTPDGEEPLKTVYNTDITFAAIKALQEAMTRIEVLEQQNTVLTQRVAQLEGTP